MVKVLLNECLCNCRWLASGPLLAETLRQSREFTKRTAFLYGIHEQDKKDGKQPNDKKDDGVVVSGLEATRLPKVETDFGSSSLPQREVRLTVTCDHGYWLCSDGTLCIPQNETCSGVAECNDESDEAVGLCGCLPNEYQCSDSCIDNLRRCDTVKDCLGGEDELLCETWFCPESHFKCTSGHCVPSDAVCNFVDDCGDASDEHQCDYRTCFYGEFKCANGECIRPGLVCDDVVDCIDGTDETQCRADDFVSCGSGRRVHRFFWCDGWPDCTDNHADELNCGPCKHSEFKCPDSQCIASGNKCDAQCDCVDCADEQNCHTYDMISGTAICRVKEAITCVVNAYQRSKDRCVAVQSICDGFNHCHNGEQISDETGCGNTTNHCTAGKGANKDQSTGEWFQCSDGRCLPGDVVCNREADCLNGEDEEGCYCSLTIMAKIQDDDRKASLVFVGDFNAHHREWLNSVSPTDRLGLAALDFASESGSLELWLTRVYASTEKNTIKP
ncbi:G-protein coupled receptor GRL101-like [Palaemon carinicauda]|uniref:G-protein coupled receptor GRL101-like n=1 Tax=Palaemon carinicauda TaxID=392227 RepID=UPI0035B5CADA